jgi:hypothetical protein
MAGCGLGSIVFGNQPGLIQILAATTNGTFANQTFGITSGTSNCAEGGVSLSSAADQEAFVKVNYASLTRDAATGKGEYLQAMATLLGCDAEARPVFYGWTQTRHSDLFTSDVTPEHTLAAMKNQAAAEPTLRDHCTRLQ